MKLRITVEGKTYEVDVEVLDEGAVGGVAPASAPAASSPAAPPPRPAAVRPAPAAAGDAGASEIPSPIAGNVLDVKVKAGDTVEANDVLLVLEAMKMETNVSSPRAGTIADVKVAAGDAVQSGQVLITFA
ncbi:biotin/lipoyl-containing protein [Mucisphaera sp.]|uniref:biotin/lipoyl-containing protein n=1 Tax=Mucisphaera sp. TaxID=2913024 RepID=UPI003D142A4B